MNFSLYHHRKLTDIIPVPNGLPNLMTDMVKQVLKFEPENIEEFLAGYLDALVKTREIIHVAETTVQHILVHSLEVGEIIRKTNISESQANQVSKIVNGEFAKYSSQCSEPIKEFDIMKRLLSECELSASQAKNISKIIYDSMLKLIYNKNDFKISKSHNNDDEKAASKIQLWYRTNKLAKQDRQNFKMVRKSALIIQKSFRDYMRRKKEK